MRIDLKGNLAPEALRVYRCSQLRAFLCLSIRGLAGGACPRRRAYGAEGPGRSRAGTGGRGSHGAVSAGGYEPTAAAQVPDEFRLGFLRALPDARPVEGRVHPLPGGYGAGSSLLAHGIPGGGRRGAGYGAVPFWRAHNGIAQDSLPRVGAASPCASTAESCSSSARTGCRCGLYMRKSSRRMRTFSSAAPSRPT